MDTGSLCYSSLVVQLSGEYVICSQSYTMLLHIRLLLDSLLGHNIGSDDGRGRYTTTRFLGRCVSHFHSIDKSFRETNIPFNIKGKLIGLRVVPPVLEHDRDNCFAGLVGAGHR